MLCFVPCLGEEEDHGVVGGGVNLGIVRVLLVNRYRRELIELASLAVLGRIGGQVKRQSEIRGREMDSFQKQISYEIEGGLLLGPPSKCRGFSSQNLCHWAGDNRIIRTIFPRDNEQPQDAPKLVDVVWWDEVSNGVKVL